MARLSIQAGPTKFHNLLRILDNCGLLHRIYSQNVDGLEAKVGFDVFSMEKARRCILLHGTIATVRCEKCASVYMLENFLPLLKGGDSVDCPACLEKGREANASEKRARAPGRLRPNILLFNEPCSMADEIAEASSGDLDLVQNKHVLLISGTSLKIPGIKSILKGFINAMVPSKRTKCAIIYVDTSSKVPSILPEYTLHVQMDCQQFAECAISRIKSQLSTRDDQYSAERRDFRPLWDWS